MTEINTYLRRNISTMVAVGISIFLLSWGSSQFFASAGMEIAIIRPAVGLGVGIMLAGGKRYWPGILVGSILSRALFGSALISSITNGLGITLGCLFCYWLLNRDQHFDPSLPSLNDYLRLVLWAGICGPLVTALAATAAMTGSDAAFNIECRSASWMQPHWTWGRTPRTAIVWSRVARNQMI